ncbi:hypothetical protein G4B88_031406 [Cannabis sativa]|uniref:Uncharacterized protein n=1 Tax=Cannabis sativa TaxID=3483 RepID=A0A7J6DVL2_CANSA|nr:hypothetical protein G4B88_019281 [Cannabis sativa]KAF4366037.1 hypothetical protein G4B88_031406 [Cannabis sativa]
MDQSGEIFIGDCQKMKNKEILSKRVKPILFREEEEEDDVNALAEAFIKNFRKQLKIQREESFKRFHEMIGREGT